MSTERSSNSYIYLVLSKICTPTGRCTTTWHWFSTNTILGLRDTLSILAKLFILCFHIQGMTGCVDGYTTSQSSVHWFVSIGLCRMFRSISSTRCWPSSMIREFTNEDQKSRAHIVVVVLKRYIETGSRHCYSLLPVEGFTWWDMFSLSGRYWQGKGQEIIQQDWMW